jgi:acyl carrier protein
MKTTEAVIEVIKSLIDETHQGAQLGPDSNLKELGIDSLKFMLMILSLEERLEAKLDVNKLSTVKVVSDVAEAVMQ